MQYNYNRKSSTSTDTQEVSTMLIAMIRHGKSVLSNGSQNDKSRALTDKGREEVLKLLPVFEEHDFDPKKVHVAFGSDALRTEETILLLTGGSVHTHELPELRLMGVHERKVTRDIMLSQGEGATFRTLLAADTRGLWMSHAQKVAKLIHILIAEDNAQQVLVVGHEDISVIGMAFLDWKPELLLGRPFGYAEGFVIDTENNTVTRIAKDSP